MTDNSAALAELIENDNKWQNLMSAVSNGKCPQSVAVVVHPNLQEEFVKKYSKAILGDCGWSNEDDLPEHPDLINAGSYQSPPSIADCRTLDEELSLHPVSSDKRLAVIWSADRLSLEAENSLLKITEEPPENAYLLFVCDEDKLISTIKSRVWFLKIDIPCEIFKPEPAPDTPEAWAAWLKEYSGKKIEADAIIVQLEKWCGYYAHNGNIAKAANLEMLMRMIKLRNISLPMMQDLVFAVVQEEISCEQIFSNLR